VQRWLRSGRLPGVRVGSRLKVDADALARLAAHGPAGDRPSQPIRRLLVANRGELVVRIARTCRQLGMSCLALVPEDQARAWWTLAADEIVPLRGSYLDAEAVLDAALAARADAIHPGYGFLAENASFAEAVLERGIRWVGPPPAAMRAIGDKAAARALALRAGVPILPGYEGADQSDGTLLDEARRIGFPLLIKPSAGGGGKGMHVVRNEPELSDALARARREATSAFGDDRLILERHLAGPRHVEVQLLADSQGGYVHLGERECSLQRRHQKVVEEAPSGSVTAALRTRLGDAALSLARIAGYEGAGTAEFLLDEESNFYFLELNARLQVEHPVTELVTRRDLVADQLAIAGGHPLDFAQEDVQLRGHAVEARLYAEDPYAGFLPASGEVLDVVWPQIEGVRIDAGVGAHDVVGLRYDPLLAKLVAHGDDRRQALERLDQALETTSVLGVTTNRGFLRWLLALPEVQHGQMDTELIEQRWQTSEGLPEEAWRQAAAALTRQLGEGLLSAPVGFRLNAPPHLRIELDGEERSQQVPSAPSARLRWIGLDQTSVMLDVDGRAVRAALATPPTVETAIRHAAGTGQAAQLVSALMPGSVLAVRVAEGDEVEAGQVLVVLEAMKMENAVSAAAPALVKRVLVEVGQQVQRGDALVELA
jgi:acetyl-CoA/propionyl-CoA carboxylase biotin carboxyl carrier protein